MYPVQSGATKVIHAVGFDGVPVDSKFLHQISQEARLY